MSFSRVKSLVNGESLEGISSIRLHSGRDYVDDRQRLFIRWTEVFLLSSSMEAGGNGPAAASALMDPPDPMSAATAAAKSICAALAASKNLKAIKEGGHSPLAVRITLDPEMVRQTFRELIENNCYSLIFIAGML